LSYFKEQVREAYALDILENAVVESVADDTVTLRVDRALWREFTGPSKEQEQ